MPKIEDCDWDGGQVRARVLGRGECGWEGVWLHVKGVRKWQDVAGYRRLRGQRVLHQVADARLVDRSHA